MIDSRIELDEWYYCESYNTVTFYFTAPKELLKPYGEFLDAVSMEISIECPRDSINSESASVMYSPTDDTGSDYDWFYVDMPEDQIKELIEMALKKGGGFIHE